MTNAANQPALFEPRPEYRADAPVTCLGLTFASDAARRAHFTERLREKLRDPAFRAIEGFPIGTDEAILALSDPPYYTACPNPWLGEIIAEWQAIRNYELGIRNEEEGSGIPNSSFLIRNYHREPFAADVSEGKNDPIYNAHSYHTKVPHKAIMRYILHYTDPGDIVFDGFCGTGMTGVAAQLCGDRRAVEELGYRVDGDGIVYDGDKPISRLGARRAVLNDLSPAATFIAYNYNTPVDVAAFEREARRILKEVEDELGWMYETWHPHCDDPGRVKAKINFTVWSEVFNCPQCGIEIVYFDAAFDMAMSVVNEEFSCPQCAAILNKKGLERSWQRDYDQLLQKPHALVKYAPVLINYQVGKTRYEKKPDDVDKELIQSIEVLSVNIDTPFAEMIDGERKRKDGYHLKGITHLHHFYFKRPLLAFSHIWKSIEKSSNYRVAKFLQFFVQGNTMGFTKLNRYRRTGFSQVNQIMSGALFVGSLISEVSPHYSLTNRLRRLANLNYLNGRETVLTCQSTTQLNNIPDHIADYLFIDPPFGNNLHYSELNFLWENWLSVRTRRDSEAVMDKVLNRKLVDYQQLMVEAFSEAFRKLKPGRWMTVEFHNSQNRVWNAIQEAILRAGFVVADVRTLDKQQETYKQSVQKLVKQDLVISAYKPTTGFEQRFLQEAGTADGAWDFVRQHLGQLPVAVEGEAGLEQVAERQDYLLFDRMVAFHIQRGAAVPLSAAEFYAGLRQRFDARDGMYFLKEQAPAYDAARLRAGQPAQLALFVSDEKSSIQWLRQQMDPALGGRPQTYQEIQPAFLRGLHQAAHEALPELRDLLQDNFLPDESGRWHAPDPNKAEDLERLRRRALLAEFETYLGGRGKLKQFRTEAVRAGFADAWRRKEFGLILRVAERLPERVVQEDPDLLMYYDTASLRN